MINKFISGIFFTVIIVSSISADLILYSDSIVYDTHADQYWFRPIFYDIGPDRTFEGNAAGVQAMNSNPSLTSDNWSEWYVARHSDILKLVENDLEDFRLFQASDRNLYFEYIRLYDRPHPSDTGLTGILSVYLPDPNIPEEEGLEPGYQIGFASKSSTGAGGAGAMGIWATARGTKTQAVPEPSSLTFVLTGLAGLLFMVRKKE